MPYLANACSCRARIPLVDPVTKDTLSLRVCAIESPALCAWPMFIAGYSSVGLSTPKAVCRSRIMAQAAIMIAKCQLAKDFDKQGRYGWLSPLVGLDKIPILEPIPPDHLFLKRARFLNCLDCETGSVNVEIRAQQRREPRTLAWPMTARRVMNGCPTPSNLPLKVDLGPRSAITSRLRMILGQRGASPMEMHQVRYFLAVARALNFTRAAEECHVAQP